MKRIVSGILSIILLLLVSACAIAEVAQTPVPPLTLGPGPTIRKMGSCNQTSDLESWAQAAYYQTTDFMRTFSAAAARGPSEVYDDVIHLQDVRNNMISRPTPDCALEAQSALADAMEKALRALQSYSNGDLKDLQSLLPDLNARLQHAVALESGLLDQLMTRFPQSKTPTSADAPGGG